MAAEHHDDHHHPAFDGAADDDDDHDRSNDNDDDDGAHDDHDGVHHDHGGDPDDGHHGTGPDLHHDDRPDHDHDDGADHDHHRPDHDHHGLRAAGGMMMVRGERSERGAAMVEAAITAPLLFVMLFGIIELSLLFRDRVALDAVGFDAARAAAISGNDQDADFHVLEVIMDSASPIAEQDITKIVIFEADGPDDSVPPVCLTGSQDAAEQCNRYMPGQFAEPLSDFGCRSDRNLDRFWCPYERVVTQSAANGGPPDYIGVHLEFKHTMVTGFFGGERTMSTTSILRIEPRDL
ncbi:MAG: TadE/TadG family type IV pilus assembly protein [Acidimicrobiales bacterium]